MLGDLDWFGTAFGAFPEGDITWNAKAARAMIREGLAVVLIEAGGKKPLCVLNTRDRKAADVAAQDAARERGAANWQAVHHDCGLHHALTEEKQLGHVRVKELLAGGCNLAVSPAHSARRIIVVDVDTDAERLAFLRDCEGLAEDVPLTVTSPGVFDKSAEVWKHRNGGHLWLDVPEGAELPERPGKATWCTCHAFTMPSCPHAWAAYWGSGYILTPPSVRPEGPYRVTGTALPAPPWLVKTLQGADRGPAPGEIGEVLNVDQYDSINAWSAATSWADILVADGFTPADTDNCGCLIFTRPGATNEKSATAHEVGCVKFDTSTGHGPLHAWSDALRWGGRETVSKLTYVAHTRYGGDTRAAMDALGIERRVTLPELDDLGPVPEGGQDQATNAEPEGLTEFWDARPVLRNIHDFALSRYAEPTAVLGSILAYVLVLTSPRATVDTVIGPASLNLYVGLVGESGTGKDQAREAAEDWIGDPIKDDDLYQRDIGTGQALSGAFVEAHRDKDDDNRWKNVRVRETVLVKVSEFDQLAAHAKQQASNLIPTLRSGFMGQILGSMYKDKSKDISVGAGTYRMCMVVGIQPTRARPLIDDVAGGLPQRFLWMPAKYTNIQGLGCPKPDRHTWKSPVRCRPDPYDQQQPGGSTEPAIPIPMCQAARDHTHAERIKAGQGLLPEMDQHANLVRCKVAAAFALLDERQEVNDEDWRLSGFIDRLSRATRDGVIHALNDVDKEKRKQAREEHVETAVATSKAMESTVLAGAKKSVLRQMGDSSKEWMTKKPLKEGMSGSAQRDLLDDALESLTDAGQIERRTANRGKREWFEYRANSHSQ